MSNRQGRHVIVTFGLFKELAGCVRLLGDLTADIMARPNPIKNGQLLCGIGYLVDEVLRPKQHFGGLACCVAVDGNHCLAEHYLQPERRTSACRTLGTRLQQFKRLGQVPDRLRVRRTLDRPLAGLSQVVDGPLSEAGLDEMMCQELGLGFDRLGKSLLEGIGNSAMKLLPFAAHQGAICRVLNQRVLEYIG